MLLNSFKVSGFKVFGKTVEINMVPQTKNYQSLSENLITSKGHKNLKSALIYGGNNTGKSSMLDAFLVFKKIITDGNLTDFPFDVYQNFCYDEKTIFFEVSFFDGKSDIIYSLEFDDEHIAEIIYLNEQLFFSRKREGEIAGSVIEDVKIRERIEDLPLNKLFLTYMNEYVANPKTDIFYKIKQFFDKIVYLDDSAKNLIMSKEILEFVNNPKKMMLLNKLTASTEVFVDKREFASEDYVINNAYYHKHISKEAFERMKTDSKLEGLRMVSYYKNKKGESVPKPSVLFDSIGTNKFIVMSMFVINAILNHQILLIDEIDNSLHYKLTRSLTILMNSEANIYSQFIMSTHDVKLLSPHIFRKDQINFIIRDHEAVSILSLDDFKANSKNDIRSNSNFEKMYVEERIVDLPDTNIAQIIKDIKKIWQK